MIDILGVTGIGQVDVVGLGLANVGLDELLEFLLYEFSGLLECGWS